MDELTKDELALYPLELQPIIKVLFDYEEYLSDDFAFYMSIDAIIEHPSDLFIRLARDLQQAVCGNLPIVDEVKLNETAVNGNEETADLVKALRSFADTIERRGVEVGSLSCNFTNGTKDITDRVLSNFMPCRYHYYDGHVTMQMKYRYADWEAAIEQEVNRLNSLPVMDEVEL